MQNLKATSLPILLISSSILTACATTQSSDNSYITYVGSGSTLAGTFKAVVNVKITDDSVYGWYTLDNESEIARSFGTQLYYHPAANSYYTGPTRTSTEPTVKASSYPSGRLQSFIATSSMDTLVFADWFSTSIYVDGKPYWIGSVDIWCVKLSTLTDNSRE
jgi:hypothetical protein